MVEFGFRNLFLNGISELRGFGRGGNGGGGGCPGFVFFASGKDLFDDGGGAFPAGRAWGVNDAALGESELAAAGAQFGVESVESDETLFRG